MNRYASRRFLLWRMPPLFWGKDFLFALLQVIRASGGFPSWDPDISGSWFDAGKAAKRGGKQVSALNSRVESARWKMLRIYVLGRRSAAFCLKRAVFPRRKKKYIPKSDSTKDFYKALIFYGHFHDIMKYRRILFHVFFSWAFKAKHGCRRFFGVRK